MYTKLFDSGRKGWIWIRRPDGLIAEVAARRLRPMVASNPDILMPKSQGNASMVETADWKEYNYYFPQGEVKV